MELAKCSKDQMVDALLKNKITKAEIESTLTKQENTLSTISNTKAIKSQTLSEEDELLQKWLSISAEEADTAATNTNTISKGANLSITNMLKVALAKLNAVIIANPLIAFGVAVVGVTAAMMKLKDILETTPKEAREAFDKAKENADSLKSEVDSLNSELQTTQSRIDELNAKENLTLVEQEELNRLKETNEELERELRIKRDLLTTELQEANKDAKKFFNTKVDGAEYDYNGQALQTDYITATEQRIDKIEQYNQEIKDLEDDQLKYQRDNNGKSNALLAEQIENRKNRIEEYKTYVGDAISDFMESDDYLIEGQDDGLLKRLDALYEKFDIYSKGKASVTENKIKDILAKADFQSVSKQLEELGKSGELSVATLSSQFPELIEYLDKAGISAEELYQYIMALSNPDAIKYDEVEKQFKESLGMRDGEINGASDQKIQDKIDSSFDDYEREIVLDAYLKVRDQYGDHPEGWNADDWISNVQSELDGKEIEVKANISFDQAWADSFTSENEEVKKLGDNLLDLAEKGRLTIATFNEADSTEYFKNLGISADEAVRKINALVDESKQLSSMSDQISKMATALETKKSDGFVDADTLAGFDVEVRGLESWDKFQSVLGSTTSTYQECQEAANNLATEWVNNSDFLAQLTEQNKEYYETQLEAMGIENYEEVIESTLALKEAKEALADINLTDVTYEDIEALIEEGKYLGLTADMIWALYDAKIAEQATTLDTYADCENLIALAGDTDRTSRSIQLLTQLMQIYNGLESGAYNGNKLLREEALEEVNRIKDELEKLANGESEEVAVKPNLKVNGSKGKKSGGSKSKTEKDTTKEYDWIEQAIENVEKEIKELDEVADSSYSTFSQKNEALTNEIGKVTEEIELQQKAYEEYMRKADSIGLPDSYKELVQSGAINIEDIKDEKLQEQIDGYQKWYEKAQNASDAIKELKTDLKDLHVESYKLQTENLKDRLDSDSITEKQYLAGLKSAYEQFYGNLEEYAEQYHEAKLEYLEEEKKYLNSVASAAASLLDTEIDRIREDADEQEEQLKGQVELLKARKKPLQDELDALDEKARKEELALNLQKAQYDLARAENQRSKLIYSEEKGMHYVNDPKEIRDAQKDLDDAKLEIHKQSIQDQIDVLDDEITKYDELIDQINKAADAQVKALEKIKNKWQEVIDQQEYAKNITILTGEFGSNAIVKILTGNDDDLLAQWKNTYLNTLKSIDLESQGYIGDLTKQIESLYRNVANTVNTASVQNSSGKAVTLSDGTIITPDGREIKPYNPENDNSSFGELYRAWTKYYGDINNNVEEIRKNLSQHLVIEHGQKMMNNVNQINNSNIRNVTNNNSKNMQPSVHVDKIEITCPGVTSQEVMIEVGNALDKQLGHLSQRAMQEAYKR